MTDVFLSYAREDRERVRRLCEGLQNLSWDVWWDPSEPHADAEDVKLGSAGAVMVVWSMTSRYSEYVRAEAATGLYRNKLIQVRIDSVVAPRPFDQSEAIDMSAWDGDRDDPNWNKLLTALKVYAGAPGSVRPQVTRGKAAAKAGGRPSYLERRTIAAGPLAALLALTAVGGGVWYFDPLHWRTPGEPKAEKVAEGPVVSAEPMAAPAKPEDAAAAAAVENVDNSPAAARAWASIKRDDALALRGYLITYPNSAGAESARSLLRVLDAQTWVQAVDDDNEAGYAGYLKKFPEDATIPGQMSRQARERMASLGVERQQAVQQIQKGLHDLKLYSGRIDGKPGDGTVDAVRSFAQSRKRTMINLKTSAPRDLRGFSDFIAAEGRRATAAAAAAAAAPKPEPVVTAPPPRVAAPATTTPARTPAVAATTPPASAPVASALPPRTTTPPASTSPALTAAAEADRLRQQQAAVAAAAAARDAAETPAPAADALAAAQLRPPAPPAPTRAAFAVEGLPNELRAAIEAARQAQGSADRRAASARTLATRADTAAQLARQGAAGTRSAPAPDGGHYEGQVTNGALTGLGVRTGSGVSSGDKYRGEVRNGQSAGVGVYEFADNANNPGSAATKYEGEIAPNAARGLGVTYWRNGDSFSGQEAQGGVRRGVMKFANGQRYDGETRDGLREGYGVLWSADGEMLQAGRWSNGQLVEPAAP